MANGKYSEAKAQLDGLVVSIKDENFKSRILKEIDGKREIQ